MLVSALGRKQSALSRESCEPNRIRQKEREGEREIERDRGQRKMRAAEQS